MKSIELVKKFIDDFQNSPEKEFVIDPEKFDQWFYYAIEGIIHFEKELTEHKFNLSIIDNDDGTISLWKDYDFANMHMEKPLFNIFDIHLIQNFVKIPPQS